MQYFAGVIFKRKWNSEIITQIFSSMPQVMTTISICVMKNINS